MLDIDLIRKNPQFVKENLAKRLCEIDIDEVVESDLEWKKSKELEDSLRKKRNDLTEEIKNAKMQEKPAKRLVEEAKQVADKIVAVGKKTMEFSEKRNYLIERLPNLIDDSVPEGPEENFKIVKEWGKKPSFDFKPKQHHELGQALGILDMSRAAKLAGTGFYMFRGPLARIEWALINYFRDFHFKNGFEEICPPFLVNSQTAFGTGNLPKFEKDLYKTTDGFYLIPTAEVPVTNIYANEVLEESELPKRFYAYTPCYRTEAGKHGSETPGFFRLHQFDKVEMVFLSKPEDSWKMHEEMLAFGEKLIEGLELHYRTKMLAAGDCGIASAKTYDLEVYAPGMGKYLETSSISNCTDFQARRMNTKYKTKDGSKLVHTLNGSGLATPRLMIALMETFQTKEGNIKVPTALQPYMNGLKEITPGMK